MGKTTLVRSVMGLIKPSAGSVAVAGQAITGQAPHRISRTGLALVPEGRQVFANLSVEEHLTAFHRIGSGGQWTPQRLFVLFPRLAERRHHMGNQLSGGEQQMLAIARALVTNPQLLILDEATEGLAPLVREEIWRVLLVLREAGHAMLVIDKYVRRLIRIADRHVILEKGRVVWTGTSDALDADRSLWHRYLGV
jgi:branched-chain amino acid transport system ATP-binding protein